MSSIDKIKNYYNVYDEWSRLDSEDGQVELYFAMRMIRRHFGLADTVLDLGGGAGRVSIEMAKIGYDVVLSDLSPSLLEKAKYKVNELGFNDKVTGFHEVNVTNLDQYEDESFNSIYCAGPFYHLVNEEERMKAIRSINRILKPGGTIIATMMPRISGVKGLLFRMSNLPDQVPSGTLTRTYATGVFNNASNRGFQEGYFFEVDGIESFFTHNGFTNVEIRSLKGLASGSESDFLKIQRNSPELFQELVELIDHTAGRKDILSWGDQIQCVFKKV